MPSQLTSDIQAIEAQKAYQMARKALLSRAFNLVQPTSHWKDPIDAVVTEADMRLARVTLPDILDAVEFYTSTTAKWRLISGTDGKTIRFTADGYRRGPAGDH